MLVVWKGCGGVIEQGDCGDGVGALVMCCLVRGGNGDLDDGVVVE